MILIQERKCVKCCRLGNHHDYNLGDHDQIGYDYYKLYEKRLFMSK